MAQGYACKHPSWIAERGRKDVTPFPNVVKGSREDEKTQLATA